MSISGRIFAAAYDRMSAGTEKAGLADHRRKLLAGARGCVLEIGAGTGANLAFFGDGVESLTVVGRMRRWPSASRARPSSSVVRSSS